MRIKTRLYRVIILSITINGAETWALQSQDIQALQGFRNVLPGDINGIT